MKKIKTYLLWLAVILSAGATFAQEVQIIYVNKVDAPNTPANEKNAGTAESVLNLALSLNQTAPSGVYYNENKVDTVKEAVAAAKANPSTPYVVCIHGQFTADGTTFVGKVTDMTGHIPVTQLPNTGNITYYYCGMNGDNKTVTTNDVGRSLVKKYGGSYDGVTNDKKMDAAIEEEVGDDADEEDDDEGDDDSGDSGEGSSNDDGTSYWGDGSDGGSSGDDGSGDDGSGDGGDDGSGDGGDDGSGDDGGDWGGSWYDS
jgi:hypothetical protein